MSGDGTYTGFHTLFSRQNLPACANACFTTADLGGCAETDNACLCQNRAFVSSILACIEKACTGYDLTAALNTGEQLCLGVGVTLSAVPTGSTTTRAASSPATTSVASSSSTPASISSTPASISSPPTSISSPPASISSPPASISSPPASNSGSSGTLTSAIINGSTGSNSANGRSTVIGPIIGGVVGFLVLVVFVMGLIWFCKFRQERGVRIRRFSSNFSPTSAEHPLVLPSSIVEPFWIPSAAPQNSGQLQSSNEPISAGGPLASPSMKQVEVTRSLIPITTQTPSSMQMSSPSADTPIGGLYSPAMVGSGSRMVLHQDSGIRLPMEAGEDEAVVEMPPLYTAG